MRIPIRDEEGQAVMLVVLALGIFLIGAVGLGIDGSMLYSERQMAQAAADSAAQAAMMSVFDGTYNATGKTTDFPLTTFNCSNGYSGTTPCLYAGMNGFGGSDVITVSFPASTSAPGVTLTTTGYPAYLVEVDVSRSVPTTLMRFLGPTATTVTAKAMAAIVSVTAPVPILVSHPTQTQSLSLQGNPSVTICGGPSRSIEVNSSDSNALHIGGASASIDLSHAGPLDPGNCTTGTGADFGVWGGPSTAPSQVHLGTKPGKYIAGASWMQDPLANVNPPDPATLPAAPAPTALANSAKGCPASPKKACLLYSPGIYAGGINGDNSTPVFQPGIYYIQGGGMVCRNNCSMYMATGVPADSTTGTSWAAGNMLVYNTGPSATPTNAGIIDLGANGNIYLTGSPSSSSYQGILFFEDRSSKALSHSLGGGGALQLQGTIYLTNTRATMLTTPTQFQSLTLTGNSGSSTLIQGEIIVGTLTLGGGGGIEMDLNSLPAYIISEVALVN